MRSLFTACLLVGVGIRRSTCVRLFVLQHIVFCLECWQWPHLRECYISSLLFCWDIKANRFGQTEKSYTVAVPPPWCCACVGSDTVFVQQSSPLQDVQHDVQPLFFSSVCKVAVRLGGLLLVHTSVGARHWRQEAKHLAVVWWRVECDVSSQTVRLVSAPPSLQHRSCSDFDIYLDKPVLFLRVGVLGIHSVYLHHITRYLQTHTNAVCCSRVRRCPPCCSMMDEKGDEEGNNALRLVVLLARDGQSRLVCKYTLHTYGGCYVGMSFFVSCFLVRAVFFILAQSLCWRVVPTQPPLYLTHHLVPQPDGLD